MRRRNVFLIVLALVCAIALSGCAQIRAQVDGAQTDTGSSDPPVQPLLKTTEWGVTNGLLSVLVRNTHNRTLRTATVTLQAFDRSGAPIGSFGPDALAGESACCTVVELQPTAQFGLYFAIGPVAAKVASIKLTYQNISFEAPSTKPSMIRASAQGATLGSNRTDVAAVLHNTSGSVVPLALVQAVLRGRSGKLIAVVTGRWSCLTKGERRPITMQLFQPVPAGTHVASVTARPVTLQTAPTCA